MLRAVAQLLAQRLLRLAPSTPGASQTTRAGNVPSLLTYSPRAGCGAAIDRNFPSVVSFCTSLARSQGQGVAALAKLPATSVSAARHTADRPSLGVSATGAESPPGLRFQGCRELAGSWHRNHWLGLLGHLRHGLSDTHISRSGRPSREQRPARCWQEGAPARDRAPAAGYPRRP